MLTASQQLQLSHQDMLGHQTTLLVRGLFWTNACSVRPCSNLKSYVCEASALCTYQMHSHARCASVRCTSNIPYLAVQGFADGDCSGDVIIPRPRHHDLCVTLTCIAVLHLHRQTCSALRVMCVSISPQTAGLTWCCISPAQTNVHHFVRVGSNFFVRLPSTLLCVTCTESQCLI